MKKLYVGRIRPVLKCDMTSTCTAAKSKTEKTYRIQKQAMRMMTGAMRSTPISALETATGLQSLEDRSSVKLLTQAEKFKRLTDHPMHSRTSKPTKGRLKRSNFIHHSRSLRENSLNCWVTCQNPSRPMQLSPAEKHRSSQPSSRAYQVSKEKQPSQTLRKDSLP